MEEADMRAKIDAYPYDEVWGLYEERPEADGVTKHDVGFEADNWEYVDRMKHDQIVERFIQATAKACGVEESAVTSIRVSTYPHLMKITCHVKHLADVDESAINNSINRYPYDEVWDLYLDAPVGVVSGLLSKTFHGEDWDWTLENSPHALHDAFVNDASRCLRIPRSAVTVKGMKCGSLIVDYTVRTNNMEDSEINSRIDAYPFPEVWSLYKPRQGERGAPTNQRIFKGASWEVIVEKKRNELRDAFVADTAEALDTDTEKVQLTSVYTTEGGLVVNFRTQKDGAGYEEVARACREGEYTRTWELYRQFSDDGFVISEHEVGFDGENWRYVVEKNKTVLVNTFVMATAEELGLQRRHVTDLKPAVDSKGVSFKFDVKRPKEWKNKEIDTKLSECAYTAVWELYEMGPHDPKRIVVTSHEVNFEGEDWDYTLLQKRATVERAFKEDIAEALKVAPAAVSSVRFEKTENGMVIGANVQHAPALSAEQVAAKLVEHAFDRVWATYLQRPVGPRGDLVSSTHQVGFEGERWREVMAARRVRVVDALRVDTAQALHIPPEDVTDIITKESPNMLVVTLTVQHPRASSTKEVQAELSKYEYERVWALYDDIVSTQVDVMKPRANNTNMSNLLTKRFDGTDWDLALDAYPGRLRTAFVLDTADVLQSVESAVVVDGMVLGSLVVQYRVRDLSMSEERATELANNYAYPRVWALYRSRENNELPPMASYHMALASSRAPAQSALSQTPRRSTRFVESVVGDPVDEEAARREAEQAQRAAQEAQARGEEAARASRAAREALQRADEEAHREEEEAQRALERARHRRATAKQMAEAAQAEEARAPSRRCRRSSARWRRRRRRRRRQRRRAAAASSRSVRRR
ncbi:mitotubule-associated protein Gb4 [Strigomonas culicis]|uniref:Mitotubule-associated protein Gb4 n=1 Tax=Strigomonas culicis TaxID=28005 RepID=S9UXN8_9TRYP|nr:mitotubule-associated protein Gb4 [Strigomonas culicis]|eukprot:EPY19331.1 mitotubule-associated protein Gb4 [Strigomonas culicis]